MIRAVIIAATFAVSYCLWQDQPPPAKVTEVPYCVIDFPVAGKDELGNWHYGWGKGYGPCSQQDIYRNI